MQTNRQSPVHVLTCHRGVVLTSNQFLCYLHSLRPTAVVLGTTQTQPVQQIPRSTYGKLMVPLIALCDNVPGEVKGSGTGEEGGQGGASRLHTTPVGLLPSPSSASLIVTRSVAASSWPRQLAVIRTHPMRSTCKATPENAVLTVVCLPTG